MLILFDQATPVGIRHSLPGHIVKTAYEQGWSTLLNGELLRAAEEAGFELLLTPDKNIVYQQNLSGQKNLNRCYRHQPMESCAAGAWSDQRGG
jgi:hypothetical protein